MKLSGPVDCVEISFENKLYILLSDRHNSTRGSCPGNCLDIDLETGTNIGNGSCETILYFLDRHLKQGVDFFLEASFVLQDAPRPKTLSSETDYIDKLLFLFHDFLLRNKRKYTRSYIHYVDIRDFFFGNYNPSGTREMVSANPFSGSVIVKAFNQCVDRNECLSIYQQAKELISFILNNAWNYFNLYIGYNEQMPIPQQQGSMFHEYRQRLERINLLKTTFHGRNVIRIAKQLFKLDKTRANLIERWARKQFQKELTYSVQSYRNWIAAMDNVFSEELSEELFFIRFDSLKTEPIICLVALSSVIMDVYTLARCFYHSYNPKAIFYCGSAHINNYVEFFTELGGKVVQKSVSVDNLERCLVSL